MSLFRKKKLVDEEEIVPVQVHERKVRKKDKKKTASVSDVLSVFAKPKEKEVEESSIFKAKESDSETETVIQKSEGQNNGIFRVMEETRKKKTLPTAEEIARAFHFGDSSVATENLEEPHNTTDIQTDAIGIEEVEENTTQEKDELEHNAETPKFLTKEVPGVLNRLSDITKRYLHLDFSGDVQVLYHANDAKPVTMQNGNFLLANAHVYINGHLQKWDDYFEVKCKTGDTIEVDTGIGFKVPQGYALKVRCSEEASDKYYFTPFEMLLSSNQAVEPIVLQLKAREGAYLSQTGRLIECQIVAL